MIALDRLEQIIPADQALAMKALSTSLTQVGGISELTLKQFSNAVVIQQTTRDLPQITALEQPVPATVANYFATSLAQGTGPDGSLVLVDFLGTAAGWISTDAFAQATEILTTINLDTLKIVYNTMLEVVTGVYGDPITGPVIVPAGPYAGTYTDANEIFSTVLIPAANSEILSATVTYPNQTAELNTEWNSVSAQLIRETTLQSAAQLDFLTLQANQRNSIYGFIYSLPDYGLDTQVGGTAQMIEGVADLSTFTGQSVVACLREGRNSQALSAAGIVVSNQLPEQPAEPPPQAQLIPSEYTESEASNLVIK
jgi:hypothetical protein